MSPPDSFTRMRQQGHEADGQHTLQRTVSSGQLLLFGVGAIVGSGIFVATGNVAAHNTGPAIVFSFALAAVACTCAGLCYAEFAALVPASGSAYTYVYAAFGRAAGWLVGWCLLLEYTTAAATVAVGWSGYCVSLLQSFGIVISPRYASPLWVVSPAGTLTRGGELGNLPAAALLITLTLTLLRDIRFSVRINSVLVTAKLLVIALFVICGAHAVNPANWHPFLPDNTGTFGRFGWSGVLQGAAVIFYAYLGFDTVSTAARETRNPQTDMPIGIVGSLLLCTFVYIAFSLVLTGLAPYPLLAGANPASVALDHAASDLSVLKVVVEIGAVVGLTSVELALLFGLSRILYAMARDSLMPAWLGFVGARSRVPRGAITVAGITGAILSALFPLEVLGELISIGTLCAFVVVCCGVLFLRIRRPDVARPFRTPLPYLICPFGALVCLYLLSSLPGPTWTRFLAWTATGAVLYACFGRRHE
jgi:APA family basic amino acid/polyamine antiporter